MRARESIAPAPQRRLLRSNIFWSSTLEYSARGGVSSMKAEEEVQWSSFFTSQEPCLSDMASWT